jgi:peptidoglycan/LPS O-acetylase OafA/YrhL
VSERNNFDLLRLLLAATVMLVHLHALSEAGALAPLSRYLSAEFAVQGFFVISGFLVTMSHDRSRSVLGYAEKRARRIYPAYFAVVLVAAFAGLFFSTLRATEYFGGPWLRYVAANLVFLNFLAPELPGVFQANPWRAVNGALWTIKLEVAFYLMVPILAWMARRSQPWLVALGVYAASVAYAWTFELLFLNTGQESWRVLGRQLPGQLAYFAVGMMAWWYRAWWGRPPWTPLGALGIVAVASMLLFAPAAVDLVTRPLAVGALVMSAALLLPIPGSAAVSRQGDLSYGIYIWHFPVVQVLVQAGWFAYSPVASACWAVAIVTALSWGSWRWVEKPMLRPTSHYVKAATSEEAS